MSRICWGNALAAAAATVLLATACRDAQGPEPNAVIIPALPDLGAIVVSTVTTGSPIDPDGYTVTVDGGNSQHVAPTGVVTFLGLAIGTHTVSLSDVAANCSVNSTVTVTVPLIGSGSTTFNVRCAPSAPPPTGDLTVTTATSGASGDLDPDGYTITLDGSTSRAIGINASETFRGLTPGSHSVELSGVASNCSVSGGTSRTVSVTAGGTASTSFAVSCAPTGPTTGSLTVGTATSGASGDLDPDGYTVTLDGSTSRAIGINASETFTGLTPGSHSVVLSGAASNCSVSGGTSRTVSVTAGSTASTSFAVSCSPTGPGTGSLTVTTATSGASGDLDPDGYTVSVDGGAASQPIATNGRVTFTGAAGDHSIELTGVAGNCAVSGANPRTVTVPAGGTATTTFAVSCAGAPPPSGRVTGRGQVGTGAPQNGNNVQTFDFDVRADLTGRFTGTDYSFIHPAGTPATVTVDRAGDPETSITAFRPSSSICSDPSRGVEFEGVGREDTGRLLAFRVAVCDNGPAGSGLDVFHVDVPSDGYDRTGAVAQGDIVKF